MSFATDLKDELCRDIPEDPNALHALIYGFLLFSHKFSAEEISFSVVHEPTARLFAEAVAVHCGVPVKIVFHERARGTLYKASVEKSSERKKIMDIFYHSPNEPHLRINRANIESEEYVPYFLRGAYLVCGSLADPEKDYQGVRYSYQDGYLATKALLASGREFTALFASADVMAIGAIRALAECGKRVPEDVSVIGMDGLPIGDYLVPQLTTVGQSVSAMANRSVEILLRAMEDGEKAQHETIPFRIYRRESARVLSG